MRDKLTRFYVAAWLVGSKRVIQPRQSIEIERSVTMVDFSQIDLNQFIEWVLQKPDSRSIGIEIGKRERGGDSSKNIVGFKVWAYDDSLQTGQSVQSVAEINLEAIKERQDKAKYAELKARFEKKGE
jgi:hypothetical protein